MTKKRNDRRTRYLVAAAGFAFVAGGIVGIVQGLQDSRKNHDVLDLGQTSLVIGVMLIALAVLSKYRVTVDAAYKLGYDIGDENGFQRGRRTGKPVVVDLVYPRDEVTIRQQPE